MLFDTHVHLDDRQFREDQESVIERARAAGVELMVNVGYNLTQARSTLKLVEQYDFIYGSVGMHPHDAKDLDDQTFAQLKKMAEHPKIVAVGEIGLDYYWNHSPREVQQDVFRKMIALGIELKLPLIIHDRDAHQDVFQILKEEKAYQVGGVLHCYSGSWPLAKEALKQGFYISFMFINPAKRLSSSASFQLCFFECVPADNWRIEFILNIPFICQHSCNRCVVTLNARFLSRIG
jgi:TatD DNase family protein